MRRAPISAISNSRPRRRLRPACRRRAALPGAAAGPACRAAASRRAPLRLAACERRREAPHRRLRIVRAHGGKALQPRRRLRVGNAAASRSAAWRAPKTLSVWPNSTSRSANSASAPRGEVDEHDAILLRRLGDLSSASAAPARRHDAPRATSGSTWIQRAATAAVSEGCSDCAVTSLARCEERHVGSARRRGRILKRGHARLLAIQGDLARHGVKHLRSCDRIRCRPGAGAAGAGR